MLEQALAFSVLFFSSNPTLSSDWPFVSFKTIAIKMIPSKLKMACIAMHPCTSIVFNKNGRIFTNMNNIKFDVNTTAVMPMLRIWKDFFST